MEWYAECVKVNPPLTPSPRPFLENAVGHASPVEKFTQANEFSFAGECH